MRNNSIPLFVALVLAVLAASVLSHRPQPSPMTDRNDERVVTPDDAERPRSVNGNHQPLTNAQDWRAFLTRYSEELLATDDDRIKIPAEIRQTRWMGYPSATEAAIAAAEKRLGQKLPPSLRAFYSVSNGWRETGYFIRDVLPVESIDWLRQRDPQLYHLARKAEFQPGPFRKDPGDQRLKQYREQQGTRVRRSLSISSRGDAALFLLDPGADPHDGEWPAGRWASWNPGMEWTAKSFGELMQQEYETFLRLRDKK
jgi:hypothetical protein